MQKIWRLLYWNVGHWLIGIVWIKAPLAYCNGNYVHNNVTHKNVNMLYYVYYPVHLKVKVKRLFEFLTSRWLRRFIFSSFCILLTQAIYLSKFLTSWWLRRFIFSSFWILLTQAIYLFKFLTSCWLRWFIFSSFWHLADSSDLSFLIPLFTTSLIIEYR